MARLAKTDNETCPSCGKHLLRPGGDKKHNVCRGCFYTEYVEQPQMMTKWDIADLIENDEVVGNAIGNLLDRKFEEAKAALAAADADKAADDELEEDS